MRNPMFIVLAVCFVAVWAAPSVSDAEKAAEPPAYVSAMREQCEAELGKDHKWAASIEAKIRAVYRNEVRPEVHAEDFALMQTNKRHVVLAYAALWVLAVGFLALLWLRQQRLVGEIARLERDLTRVAEEE